MCARKLASWFLILSSLAALPVSAQRRLSDDRDLIPIDLTSWDCVDKLDGSAKTQDGVERNRGKNRSMVDLSRFNIPDLDTVGFLRAVSQFDAQTKGKRRKDLSYAQKIQLAGIEREIVSFTGYLVLAYPGPPETTNCGSVDFHDWHMEVFEKPLDHPPTIGDPTPIICEITPRLQTMFYEQGIRMQDLAAFMRLPYEGHEPNGHPARKVRFTGYLLWDDDHNGTADIGPRIAEKMKNGYQKPWRSTAFEIHPVLKIEVLDAPPPVPMPAPAVSPKAEPPPAAAPLGTSAPAAPATPELPTTVTILKPIKVKIPYGETMLPAGTKVEVVARTAQSVTIRYLGQDMVVPLTATDLP